MARMIISPKKRAKSVIRFVGALLSAAITAALVITGLFLAALTRDEASTSDVSLVVERSIARLFEVDVKVNFRELEFRVSDEGYFVVGLSDLAIGLPGQGALFKAARIDLMIGLSTEGPRLREIHATAPFLTLEDISGLRVSATGPNIDGSVNLSSLNLQDLITILNTDAIRYLDRVSVSDASIAVESWGRDTSIRLEVEAALLQKYESGLSIAASSSSTSIASALDLGVTQIEGFLSFDGPELELVMRTEAFGLLENPAFGTIAKGFGLADEIVIEGSLNLTVVDDQIESASLDISGNHEEMELLKARISIGEDMSSLRFEDASVMGDTIAVEGDFDIVIDQSEADGKNVDVKLKDVVITYAGIPLDITSGDVSMTVSNGVISLQGSLSGPHGDTAIALRRERSGGLEGEIKWVEGAIDKRLLKRLIGRQEYLSIETVSFDSLTLVLSGSTEEPSVSGSIKALVFDGSVWGESLKIKSDAFAFKTYGEILEASTSAADITSNGYTQKVSNFLLRHSDERTQLRGRMKNFTSFINEFASVEIPIQGTGDIEVDMVRQERRWTVAANTTAASAILEIRGHPIALSNLTLQASLEGDVIEGTGKIDIPGGSLAVEFSSSQATAFPISMKASGALDATLLERISNIDAVATSGTALISVDLEIGRDSYVGFEARLDLERASVLIAPIGAEKSSGEAAHLVVTGNMSEGTLIFETLALNSSIIELVASARHVGGETRLDFSRLKIGKRTSLAGRVHTSEQGIRIKIDNGIFDTSDFNPKRRTDPFQNKFLIDLNLNKAKIAGLEFDNLQGRIESLQKGSATVSAAGRLKGLSPVAAEGTIWFQNSSISLRSNDAGKVFEALGILSEGRGGAITANITGDLLGGNFDMSVSGANMVAVKTHTLAHLVSVMSIVGVPELLASGGIQFGRFGAQISFEKSVMRVDDGFAHSPSLGVTFDGTQNFSANILTYEIGAYPLYAVNGFFGNLPLIGDIFKQAERGGLVGFRFVLTKGDEGRQSVIVDPMRTLLPGALDRLFQQR